MTKRGLFIVFEGNNGAGKTTIINELLKKIQNHKIIYDEYNGKQVELWNVYKFPNRTTTLGKKIDDFLKKKINLSKSVELKFFAENRAEFKDEMEYILSNGYNIICDRYIYSSMAYTLTNQTLDLINGINSNLLSIEKIVKYDKQYIKPDYVFLINGDFLHLRNEKPELYHKNKQFNGLLANNYTVSMNYLETPFEIVYNVYDKLDNVVSHINDIINKL